MTSTRGPTILRSLPVAIMVSISPGKWWWTRGWDPREGFNSAFRVDCYQGCWLCVHKKILTVWFHWHLHVCVLLPKFVPNQTEYDDDHGICNTWTIVQVLQISWSARIYSADTMIITHSSWSSGIIITHFCCRYHDHHTYHSKMESCSESTLYSGM